ncbi:hypothetical protein [Tateyamaria sp. SN3-11]|uniref:hypothetical protein n=1 Tax=Tateyamaria sp. SN3-11 TaxID=3092147 RepID=UPI0039E964FF
MTTGKLTMAMTATPTNPRCGETLSLAFTVTNATKYMIEVTSLKYTLQPGSLPLSLANNFNSVTIQCPKGWSARQNGGIFIMTPDTPADGKVGPTGLEFDINDITVNNSPGTSDVKMEQVGPDKTHYETPASLNKTWPPLAITAFYANPHNSVEYGGKPQLVWEASLGAVIALEYNGKVIRNVKNEPSQPLPSSGSYDIDDPLEQATVFTLLAQSGPGSSKEAQITQQTIVSIAPPTITDFNVTVSTDPTVMPSATLDWTTASATAGTVTTTPGATAQPVDFAAGTAQFPLLVNSVFTFTATNPATVASTSATQPAPVTGFDWVQVNPGPDTQAHSTMLLSTHAGIAAATTQGNSSGLSGLYLSADGMNWTTCATFPLLGQLPIVYTAPVSGVMTYLSGFNRTTGGLALFSTMDFITWTPLPPFPSGTMTGAGAPICADGDSALCALVMNADGMTIMRLPVGAAQWEQVGTGSSAIGLTNLQWMNGEFWVFDQSTTSDNSPQPMLCSRSSDGTNWTTTSSPPQPCGFVSPTNAVQTGHIYLLPVNDVNSIKTPSPFALWRVDQNGTWLQDTPVPGVQVTPKPEGTNVVSWDGTLFVSGQNLFTPNSGIWARKP